MKGTTVEQSDLIGEIENFPIEVVQRMVDEQVRQGNEPDVTVFQNHADEYKCNGGFEWSSSKYGYEFWMEVIYFANFNYFYEHK